MVRFKAKGSNHQPFVYTLRSFLPWRCRNSRRDKKKRIKSKYRMIRDTEPSPDTQAKLWKDGNLMKTTFSQKSCWRAVAKDWFVVMRVPVGDQDRQKKAGKKGWIPLNAKSIKWHFFSLLLKVFVRLRRKWFVSVPNLRFICRLDCLSKYNYIEWELGYCVEFINTFWWPYSSIDANDINLRESYYHNMP